MHLLQVIPVHVRINLGGGDVGVTQHLLDGPQVGAALKQMGGKTVAEGMGCTSFR